MAICGTYFGIDDIYRLITVTDGTDYYLNLIDSGLDLDDVEPVDCMETMVEEEIYNQLLGFDIDGNYGLNVIFVTPDEDVISAVCGHSLFEVDILRERIRTDGTNS